MTFEGYDAFDDPYAFPGTSVLRNLLDIRDQAVLDAYEVEISTLRAEEPLPEGEFDPEHYCNIHRHLFQDLYDWAGIYRTVRTSKGGNVFCYPENIPAQMVTLFDSIRHLEVFKVQISERFLSISRKLNRCRLLGLKGRTLRLLLACTISALGA